MKYILILLIALFGLNTRLIAQKTNRKSPTEVVAHTNGNLQMQVTYSRPSKKERLIFGEKAKGALVPYNEKWRTGANEATIISFNVPLIIEGNQIEAGSYSLYTIPNADEWVIAFNSKTGYWGKSLFGSPFKEKKDVLRIKVKLENVKSIEEQFTIDIREIDAKNSKLELKWDTTMVPIQIGF